MANLTDETVGLVVDSILNRTGASADKREAVTIGVKAALADLEGDPQAISRAAPRAIRAAIVANNPELAPFGPLIQLAAETTLDPETVKAGLQTLFAPLRRLLSRLFSWL